MFLMDMINVKRLAKDSLVIVMLEGMEQDFVRMARSRDWYISRQDAPEGWVTYAVAGEAACDEIERRVARKNPWFAFDTSDEWEGSERWR